MINTCNVSSSRRDMRDHQPDVVCCKSRNFFSQSFTATAMASRTIRPSGKSIIDAPSPLDALQSHPHGPSIHISSAGENKTTTVITGSNMTCRLMPNCRQVATAAQDPHASNLHPNKTSHNKHQYPHLCSTQSILSRPPPSRTASLPLSPLPHSFLIITIVMLLYFCCSLVPLVSGAIWQENILPKMRISHQETDAQKFEGNSTHPDHFKLLVQDGETLLVGSRNMVYNISLTNLQENKRLEWHSTDDVVRLCRVKGKSEDDCHNYIRVLAKKSDDVIHVCGTNSFSPRCRDYYHNSAGEYELLKEIPGEGLCPYDPHHNSTAVFAGSVKDRTADNLYVATVAQFSGADPLIYRNPLRTEQFNPKHLNAPNFVSSMHHDDHVYFFFRETAVEYINCGKTVYSRVARVCTKDQGGPHKFRNQWTSFVKARLNCSIPGDFPFYFNEIQSTSNFVKGVYNGRGGHVIYGVFTTPVNSLGASAVCAFRLDDLKSAFDGQFKGQDETNSNWLPVPNSKVPEPRPGKCVNDSRTLPDQTLNFVKDHTLMDQAVPSFWGQPIFMQSSFKFRFTQIAVDPQIETVSGKTFDVLFIGTDDGRIMKVINSASAAPGGNPLHNKVMPVVIEEISVFPNRAAVTNLLVYHTFYEAKLVVVSDSEIQAIPLHKCQARATTCGTCVRLQDPYCAWDMQRQVCTSSRSRFWNRENFVQNIEDGWDSRCPGSGPALVNGPQTSSPLPRETLGDIGSDTANSKPTDQMYSADAFALAVVTSIVTSFFVGFISGYIFSRRCRKEHPSLSFNPYSDPTGYTDYQIHHPLPVSHDSYSTQLAARVPLTAGIPGTGTLSGPHHVANKPINLVLNVPPKNGKTANSSADNKPMQQKVKKIYL